MDIGPLVRDLVTFLTPTLPLLISVGQEAAGQVAGEGVSATIKKIWSKLRPQVDAKPAAQEALTDLAANPKDEDAQAALRVQLRKLLESDTGLAQELATLISEAKASGQFAVASGERSVAIGRDNTGTIVTGDGNTVQGSKYQVNIDKASGIAIGDYSRVDVSPSSPEES